MRLTTSLPLFGLRPRVWLNHPGQLRLRELKATRSLVALEHALLRHIYFCFEFLYLCVCPTYKVVVLSISLLLVSFVAEMMRYYTVVVERNKSWADCDGPAEKSKRHKGTK